MKRHWLAVVLVLGAGIVRAQAGVDAMDLPPDRVSFRDGPGVETTRSNCITCHSAQYVYTQPPLTREQWQAEVAKMRNAYGAPIPPEADKSIVDYLMTQNGKAAGAHAETVQRPR